MRPRPTIMIDPGGLDAADPPGGQFRYVVDLVRGLSRLDLGASFAFLGARPEPVPELAGVFAAGGSRWRYEPFARPVGRGAMYREQVRLGAALVRERADLYHGLHTVVPVLAPCPVVATVYDLMYELFPEYAAAVRSRPYRLYRWAVRHRVRRAVCISESTARDLGRLWGVRPGRVDVVYPGTEFLDLPTVDVDVPGMTGHRVVLSPYNLEPRKNLAALVRAFAGLRTPNVRLVLYGRAAVTPEREREFDALVRELGVGAAVVRTGHVTDEQLRWLYSRADVFAFPSLYEGFGYPVLEAMAAGACVVARRAASMTEVVGPAGVLVETADPGEIAVALDRLLADPTGRERLRKQAAVRAGQFTVGRMAEQTWQTYRTALGRG